MVESTKEDYLRYRITGIDETGKFIDYPTTKVKTTDELVFKLKQLVNQLDNVHKVYIKKHHETNIIIGVDVQVKQGFDYPTYLNSGVNDLREPLPHKFKQLAGNKQYWDTITYCHRFKREILKTPVKQNMPEHVKDSDVFRESLRKLTINKPNKRGNQ